VRAELIKVRRLPTPRWLAGVAVAFLLLGLAATVRWGPGPDLLAVELSVAFPTSVLSVLFGAWLVGVEYSQRTLSRCLTGDPRRGRLVLRKLFFGLAATALFTVLLYLVSFPLFDLASRSHGAVGSGEYLEIAASSVLTNLAFMSIGVAFSLISSSMAGGMTLALIFLFLLSTALSAVPEVDDWSFLAALADLESALLREGEAPDGSSWRAAAVFLGWPALLLAAGWVRLRRFEVR
jgi:ABC-2 type transport system permease protein